MEPLYLVFTIKNLVPSFRGRRENFTHIFKTERGTAHNKSFICHFPFETTTSFCVMELWKMGDMSVEKEEEGDEKKFNFFSRQNVMQSRMIWWVSMKTFLPQLHNCNCPSHTKGKAMKRNILNGQNCICSRANERTLHLVSLQLLALIA